MLLQIKGAKINYRKQYNSPKKKLFMKIKHVKFFPLLQNQKARLDEEEMAWLRGGYENAVGVIDSLKEQSLSLRNNLAALEKEKSDLKDSYDKSIEKVTC